MSYPRLHAWDVTPAEAIRIQRELRSHATTGQPFSGPVRLVAGMDVSYDRRSPWLYAGIVVLRLPDLVRVEEAAVRAEARFPYVPGLLSFRECPAGLEAWTRLRTRPDCLLCDGHGYAHPRRFGFACHFGVLVDVLTIGVAKSILVGEAGKLTTGRGSRADLLDEGEVIGTALRVRTGVSPVFVSVGYRVTLDRAAEIVLACAPRFRIPEPIRQAHHLVNALRAQDDLRT